MNNSKYNLEQRTFDFSIEITKLCQKIPKDIVITPIIAQLIRSDTSIGANYCEANGASSKRDFRNKIYICKKEAKETVYWLKLLSKSLESFEKEIIKVLDEADQLARIFNKISFSINSNHIEPETLKF